MPRKADPREYLRRLAVSRMDDGYDATEVAEFLGVSVRSVQRWFRASRLLGESALAGRPHPGRPPKLDGAQAAMVLKWLSGNPCDFGFATQLWTAGRVTELIDRELGVQMNHRYLSRWLRQRNITPQTPARVPRERDEAEVRWWVEQLWPRIKKKRWPSTQTLYLPMKAGF